MKAGRLPENHPLEQLARAKLRAKSPQAAAKAEQTIVLTEHRPTSREPVQEQQPKRRWK